MMNLPTAAGLLAVGLSHTAQASVEQTELFRANSAFALKVHQLMANDAPDKNLLLAPYSISQALSMALAGARGATASELRQALELGELTDVDGAFATLNPSLIAVASEDGYQLNIANRLWGQESFPFLSEYIQLTADSYGAGLETMNFRVNPDAERLEINKWIANSTNDKILDLLPPRSITADTRMVLTNAVYFLGDWQFKFDERFTIANADFYTSNTDSVSVPMMTQSLRLPVHTDSELGAQMVAVPYATTGEKSTSMVIVLPQNVEGLSELESQLSAEKLLEWNQELEAAPLSQVALNLPRWRVESEMSLVETLSTLGVDSAFDAVNADFGKMADLEQIRGNLAISDVSHKKFIEVKEGGTEAAGATAVIIAERTSILRPQPTLFEANRPFLYYIKDDRSGSILFMGRLVAPN